MPMEPAHIEPMHLIERRRCALPPVPPTRTRTTHIQHSCQFLIEIIREIALLLALQNACISSNDAAKKHLIPHDRFLPVLQGVFAKQSH
jgi:hypothetical protein